MYVRFTGWALNDPSLTTVLNVLCICRTDIAVYTSCEVSCLVEPCDSYLVSRSVFSVDRRLIQLKPCSDAAYVRLFFFVLTPFTGTMGLFTSPTFSRSFFKRQCHFNDSVTCVLTVCNELMWDIPLCLKYTWVKCRGTLVLHSFINKTNYTLFCTL